MTKLALERHSTLRLDGQKSVRLFSYGFIVLLLVGFVSLSAWFGYNFKPGMVPDHEHHQAILDSAAFEGNFWIEDTAKTKHFGQVSRQPALYYHILAIPLKIFGKDARQHVILWSNIFISLVGLLCLIKGAHLLAPRDARLSLLCLWLVVNFVMFVVIVSQAQYDNLANALSFALFASLIAYVQKPTAIGIVVMVGIAAAGSLTKMTFLPLAAGAATVAFVFSWRNLTSKQFWLELNLLRSPWRNKLVLVISGAFIVGATWFYGRNIFSYRVLIPSCAQVLTKEECNKNWVVSREETLIFLNKDKPRLAPSEFALERSVFLAKQWDDYIGGANYSIETKPWRVLPFFAVILISWILAVAGGWKPHRDKLWAGSIFIVSFYYFSLLAFNYASYLKTNSMAIGLWFRYLFPVAGPAAVVFFLPIFRVARFQRFRWALVVTVLGCLVFASHRFLIRRGGSSLFVTEGGR